MSLKHLFSPRSIAVVGASDRPGSFGCCAAVNSMKSHGAGVWLVNPRKPELHGQKTYASLTDLPEAPECVMICTPRHTVLPLLREAGDLGTKAAVVFASGFSEENTPDGIAMEKEMEALAGEYGMSILGPNCAGLLNNVDKVNLWGMNCTLDMETRPSGIGVIAQSGFIASTIMGRSGLSISYVVSSGNGNIILLEDYLEYMVDDPAVRVIALYLEGVRDAERFTASLAEAAKKRKPIVILKAGKSKAGARAASSHTGNLAGNAEAYHAVFRKYGVVEVDCLEELLCMAQMFSVLGDNLPEATGIGGLNLSGGANTICADLCGQFGLTLPPLRESDKERMRPFIPGFATPDNPLDATTALFGDVERTVGLLQVFEDMPEVGGITVGNSIDITEGKVSVAICEALIEARRRGLKKPYYMVPSLEATPSERYQLKLEQNGIVVMSSAKTAYRCLSLLDGYLRYRPERHDLEPLRRAASAGGKERALTEYEAKQRIRACGADVGTETVVKDAETLRALAAQLKYPLAMKVSSPDILHKTDCGGVRLNVKDAAEAEQAFAEILKNCAENCPSAHIDGVLVGTMAPKGLEFILGVHRDPQFGPMLLAGLGGIFVELFRDAALAPCPVSREEAEDLLGSLKAAALLKGYRGGIEKDTAALAELMTAVSRYAAAHPELKEMDLNPVFVYDKGQGVRVVDALMVVTEAEEEK